MTINLRTPFSRVLAEYDKYKAAKKRVPKYTGSMSPRLAKSYVQKAQQELVVFETNLVKYQAILRRAKLTKVQSKNATRVISIMRTYIADIEKVYKIWKKYTNKNTTKSVSLITFPIKMPYIGGNFTVKLDVAINAYFKTLTRMVMNQANSANLPIIPFKYNSVNVRGKTIRQASHVETPADVLRHNVAMLTNNIEQRHRQKFINQAEYKKLKVRADRLEERLALLKEWCMHN